MKWKFAAYLEMALKCLGYSVELAQDGDEVLSCLQASRSEISRRAAGSHHAQSRRHRYPAAKFAGSDPDLPGDYDFGRYVHSERGLRHEDRRHGFSL